MGKFKTFFTLAGRLRLAEKKEDTYVVIKLSCHRKLDKCCN